MSARSDDSSDSASSESNIRRQPRSPSMFSPVGDPTRYAVSTDDDEDDINDHADFPASPVPHVLANQDFHDTSWQSYDRDLADSPRLRLESDLNAPLLNRNQNIRAKLNGLNYLNVATYLVNVFVSYEIGFRGLFSLLPTRVDVFL